MLRYYWLPINHYLLHLFGLSFTYLSKMHGHSHIKNIENCITCKVGSVIRFSKLKVYVRWKFTGGLMRYVVKEQRRKKIRGNGVGCSKKAGIIRMKRKELGALHIAPTLHLVFAICFSTSRSFWSARYDQEKEAFCRTGWKTWCRTFRRKRTKPGPTMWQVTKFILRKWGEAI